MSDNPQAFVWNDEKWKAWVTYADHFDATLKPFGEAALQALDVTPGERVVDIGCGTGATTLRLASVAAPAGVLGVDLSQPMLGLAAQRALDAGLTNVTLSQHDVEAASMGVEQFEAAYSRFGVMFFSDPVRAFINIRQSLVTGGRLAFVCFQSLLDNPFISVPMMAVAPILKMTPPVSPTAPGPFAFADPERVTEILTDGGFRAIVIEPGPTSAVLGAADDLSTMARRVIEQNPTMASHFAVATSEAQDAAVAAAAAALTPYAVDGVVTLGAATWIVSATNG